MIPRPFSVKELMNLGLGGGVTLKVGTVEQSSGSVEFVNSNGVSWTLSDGSMKASVAPGGGGFNSLQNFPVAGLSFNTTGQTGSQSHIFPFVLRNSFSWDYLRQYMSFASWTSSTACATTADATYSWAGNMVYSLWIYSQMGGASSVSLETILSTTLNLVQHSFDVSFGSASSVSHSVSISHILPYGTGYTTKTLSFASSGALLPLYHTACGISANLMGNRMIDLPFSQSLSAGQYWVGWHYLVNGTGAPSAVTFNNLLYSANQFTAPAAFFVGDFTSGHGLITTAGGGSLATVPIANITALANSGVGLFQLWKT